MVDIEEQDMIACCHCHKADEKALFDEEFTKWFNSARQFASAESMRVSTPGITLPEVPRMTPPTFPRKAPCEISLYIPHRTSPEFPREVPRETALHILCRTPPELQGETPPVTPRDVPRDTPREQLSQRGAGSSANGHPLYGSCRSGSGKSSQARLAVAQLKVKKLEEEQRLKAMECDLEKQRLQLEMERQLLDACVEVEQAQIQLSDGIGGSGEISNRSSDLPLLPKQTLRDS